MGGRLCAPELDSSQTLMCWGRKASSLVRKKYSDVGVCSCPPLHVDRLAASLEEPGFPSSSLSPSTPASPPFSALLGWPDSHLRLETLIWGHTGAAHILKEFPAGFFQGALSPPLTGGVHIEIVQCQQGKNFWWADFLCLESSAGPVGQKGPCFIAFLPRLGFYNCAISSGSGAVFASCRGGPWTLVEAPSLTCWHGALGATLVFGELQFGL